LDSYYLEYDAFIRSIKRNSNSSNVFLLGAGASISSGIQSAEDCIWEWKKDIFTSKNPNLAGYYNEIKTDAVRESIQHWLDTEGIYPTKGASEEYSFYANKAYPIAEDRRKYFQALSEKKEPYIGYKLLTLFAESEIIKSIWTTNFDGLIVKACHQMNITPIEVTLDSVERIYRNISRNEVLSIALHGDYKYGELKNTGSELDNQNEIFVKTLTKYLNDKNLIVIGYSGRDKSLMDALKLAFSERGAGRLYWCGYGDNLTSEVSELINIARSNNREAFYIVTEGFDKTLMHLAKSCYENDTDNKKRVEEILNSLKDDKFIKANFSLDITNRSYFIKSNLFPVSFPKEIFQFEIEYKPEEKPWKTVRELTKGHDVVAVPYKKKVYAISTLSLINNVFKDRLKSDIVRTPISKSDIQKVTAFNQLILSAIVKNIGIIKNLNTNDKDKIWLKEVDNKYKIGEHDISVYKAVILSLFFDDKYSYVTLKPHIHISTTNIENPIPKEIKLRLGKTYFEKLFNDKYNDFIEAWRGRIFSENKKLTFDFPFNSGSGLQFSLSDRSAFAEIMIQNKFYNTSIPLNYDPKFSLHKGIQFSEPQLLFINKNSDSLTKDFHPMRGLMNNRPFDCLLNGKVFSNEVNIGVICPQQYSEKFSKFLNELNQQFRAEVNTDYLINYPGFGFAYNIPINIPPINSSNWSDVNVNHLNGEIKEIAQELARIITNKIDQLANNNKQLVISIFIPKEWSAYRQYEHEGEKFDLHNYIKAYAAQRGVTTQLIEEETLSDNLKCQILWWLSLSFYVKSLRTPWVLSDMDKTTAFAGIGYSVNNKRDNGKIILGCSHIYNAQGQGLKYKLSKVDDYILDHQLNPFMSYNDAFQFGVSIRELFLNSINELPKRVVVHKRTRFTFDEIKGITESLTLAGIEKIDLIEITFEEDVRYFSTKIVNQNLQIDKFPLSRGVCFVISPNSALLWTHGIVPSVKNPNFKYFLGGRSIPIPLKITKHYGESNISTIATEILGLTKMNWNSFDLYTKLPATIQSSNAIAKIGNLLARFEGKTYDYRFFI
jgi:NAD-dependent SIR2 family protein deacetylase